jgi:hypothetical protein
MTKLVYLCMSVMLVCATCYSADDMGKQMEDTVIAEGKIKIAEDKIKAVPLLDVVIDVPDLARTVHDLVVYPDLFDNDKEITAKSQQYAVYQLVTYNNEHPDGSKQDAIDGVIKKYSECYTKTLGNDISHYMGKRGANDPISIAQWESIKQCALKSPAKQPVILDKE